jgi:signal transduction histidine kinase/ligand-binding sensor domain-containing protein
MRLKDGAVKQFTVADGLPSNIIRSVREDQRGGVTVSTESGEVGVQESKIVPVLYDMLQGPAVFYEVTLADRTRLLVNKSEIEVSQNGRNQRWAVGRELPGTRIQTAFADREGSLWIGTNGGLARWVDGKVQSLPVTDPLSRASVLALMEDREGNLWAGTEADGLHILRDQRFRTIGVREGLTSDATTTVVEGAAGKLWVGTSGGGLNALPRSGSDAGAAKTYSVRDVLLSDVILSLAAAPNGDLWVGTPDGLNRIRGSAVDSFTSADGLPDDFIRSLLVDADGSLWIGTRRGLTHLLNAATPVSNARMETLTHANGLGSDLVGAVARDAKGDLWVATFAGLSRLHSGKIENYTTANGLSSNVVTALLPRADGTLLIGTQDHGWNLWNGKRIAAAGEGSNRLSQTAVHAILDDGRGHLWFATGNGIARGDCPETLAPRIGVEPGGCSRWMEFGPADGLRSRETATNSHPSAWRSRDGLLWFATPKGLVEVDPAHFPVNAVPPGVALERFAIDDTPQALHAADSVMQIPAGHVHFEFDYAGLSFVAPQKVRYRYMLENFDPAWTEAGARRTAYYTNIPAGRYTFRVQAANNDGVWNTEGAALEFKLRPHFYQTLWFYALLILALVGLVVVVQRLRLKRAEREFNAVLGERNRIAREIHDTLAQGYVGISVQLEVLSELLRMSKMDAAAKHLDLTRGYVREGLADARQSIWALRSQDSGETTLPVSLRRMVESEGNHALESSFSIFGAYRPLPPGTEREILRIAQEAIHNVRKHAGARHLSVQLEYGPAEIALDVRDDGQGFAPDQGSKAGHYGLTGMRERAATIGGKLEITSEPGSGTTVRLRVHARRETNEQTKEQS